MNQQQEVLIGYIEKIIFHNPENGFTVFTLHVNKRDTHCIVGTFCRPEVSQRVEAKGIWVQDEKFGPQFKAELILPHVPTNREDIESYLSSSFMKGIGPKYAKSLVDTFGERVLEIIENNPERLSEIKGLGKKKIDQIIVSYQEQTHIQKIMMFLQKYHFSPSRAAKVYNAYGENAIQVLTENPYRLIRDIPGIGFHTCDEIASHMGVSKESPFRIQNGIIYILQEGLKEGGCGLFEESILKKAVALLDLETSLVQSSLKALLEEDVIAPYVFEGRKTYHLKTFFNMEMAILHHLERVTYNHHESSNLAEGLINSFLAAQDFPYSSNQKEALLAALQEKFLIITGGPGVGKTTVVQGIVKLFDQQNISYKLCAPTGKAAKRLGDVTNKEATTIHRLLQSKFSQDERFYYNKDNPLPLDALIVDETSMVDVPLFFNLIRAIKPSAKVILVGDVNQIPSVGPGQILKDLINSELFRVVYLQEVFRQAAESQIIQAAHCINQGQLPSLTKSITSDFIFIEKQNDEDCLNTLIPLCKWAMENFKFKPLSDIQFLTPMTKGLLGTHSLNLKLQEFFNPSKGQEVERFGIIFKGGDKVIQIVNNYDKEVFNGDTGIIQIIDSEKSEVTVLFDSLVIYTFQELDQLKLAYALTIHKSQGSEYSCVIIPLTKSHTIMLRRNLIYTGITRGKKQVILIGQKQALQRAVLNNKDEKRISLIPPYLKRIKDIECSTGDFSQYEITKMYDPKPL